MGSYKWGYKSPNMTYKYSYPTYNPIYNYPMNLQTLNPIEPHRTLKGTL